MELSVYRAYCTRFKRYGEQRSAVLDSIEIHSIGTAQNSSQPIRDYMNQWAPGGIVHAVVDAEISGKVLEILPKENVCWADAGYGNQHSYAIEIAESDAMKYQAGSAVYQITDSKKFLTDIRRGYETAVYYTAEKCREFGFRDPSRRLSNGLCVVYSHQEANALGLASAHVDPTHIWKKIGKDMNAFRAAVTEVLQKLEQGSEAKTEKIWMDWVKRESGSAGFRQTNGDSGNAYGKYQFDRRYALVPFLRWCCEYSLDHYRGFEPYIAYGSGSSRLKGNLALAHLWKTFCDRYPVEFEALQDAYAFRHYYREAAEYMERLHQIKMENHSPAVRGTLFSMAIRSGTLTGARKFEGCTDQMEDTVLLERAYSSYGNADGGRWTRAGQWGDALTALQQGNYTRMPPQEIGSPGTAEPVPSVTPGEKEEEAAIGWLRVRRVWSDARSQLGAFRDLQRAKNQADSHPGYRVYDDRGLLLYAGKPALEPEWYLVQTGVFLWKENAEKQSSSLKKAGFAALLRQTEGSWRIQCGAFQREQNARTLQSRLQRAGFDAIIKKGGSGSS